MKIVLLAGGKGKRLWPLSTEKLPKQFLKLYGDETLIEKTFNNLKSIYNENDIYIATTSEYQKYIRKIIPKFNKYIKY